MPFALTRHPFSPRLRRMRLAARTELVPGGAGDAGFVRARLQSDEPLDGFTSPGAGDHLRVFVPEAPGWASVAVDEAGHPTAPPRTETIVAFDAAAGWVDLDILVHAADAHGDAGLIGPWAARAPLGSPVVVADPKGSVVMTGRPDAVLIAGDDSAIPAIRRYLRMLDASVPGLVLLETAFDPASLGVEVPAGLELRVLAPDRARPSAGLVAELEALGVGYRPDAGGAPADVFVFACGEQSLVAPARALLARWGICVERAVVKGYWRSPPA